MALNVWCLPSLDFGEHVVFNHPTPLDRLRLIGTLLLSCFLRPYSRHQFRNTATRKWSLVDRLCLCVSISHTRTWEKWSEAVCRVYSNPTPFLTTNLQSANPRPDSVEGISASAETTWTYRHKFCGTMSFPRSVVQMASRVQKPGSRKNSAATKSYFRGSRRGFRVVSDGCG
jgi:hypothetical protein